VILFSAHGDVVVGVAIFHIVLFQKEKKKEKKRKKKALLHDIRRIMPTTCEFKSLTLP
jgi:hypothetical protein